MKSQNVATATCRRTSGDQAAVWKVKRHHFCGAGDAAGKLSTGEDRVKV